MEEKKAAAYYDELTRKGKGAARFKQGLGYNSNPLSSSSSSSSFLTTFVPASSSTPELQKQTQLLHSIQNKLSKNKHTPSSSSDRNIGHSRRTREEEEEEERNDLSRSRDRYREGRDGSSRRSTERNGRDTARRPHFRSRDEEESPTSLGEGKHHHRSGSRRRSRSLSPPSIRSERSRGDRVKGTSEKNLSKRTNSKDRNTGGIDYSQLIEGYAEMTPSERVKAKMKLQLSQTVAKDTIKGMGSGWERFDFNKEAPIDDEEIEVAEDDAALVKDLGRSFRFSAVEAKREAEIKAAHDEAIFGSSAASPIVKEEVSAEDNIVKESTESCRNLMSDQVLSMQQGSWRDRARKLRDGSNG
ncbi:splicing factor U2af large subunit B isoform X2 [Magnolia sinica]|uniref:splicing factor U2af large subunit B isoform X2 n=1 Tax=Magnolia sinica TaxID=86752 RepID=UPI00265A6FB3|nr:splicing factor U2af large subunit B isoform X2 [Magnolia sinica]